MAPSCCGRIGPPISDRSGGQRRVSSKYLSKSSTFTIPTLLVSPPPNSSLFAPERPPSQCSNNGRHDYSPRCLLPISVHLRRSSTHHCDVGAQELTAFTLMLRWARRFKISTLRSSVSRKRLHPRPCSLRRSSSLAAISQVIATMSCRRPQPPS